MICILIQLSFLSEPYCSIVCYDDTDTIHSRLSLISHLHCSAANLTQEKNRMTQFLICSCSNWEGQTSLSKILLGHPYTLQDTTPRAGPGSALGSSNSGTYLLQLQWELTTGHPYRCPIQRFRGTAAIPRASPGLLSSSLYLSNSATCIWELVLSVSAQALDQRWG